MKPWFGTMENEEKHLQEAESGLLGITAEDACEALSDPELGCSAAAAAAVIASCGASLLARAAKRNPASDAAVDDLILKASNLSREINDMAKRLDLADEIAKPVSGKVTREAISAGLDASIALLEASYFGQSLARSIADGVSRDGALDLGIAAMLLDAGAGAAMLATRDLITRTDDMSLVKRAEEMVWAITHDRIGLKKQILGIVDDIFNKGPQGAL